MPTMQPSTSPLMLPGARMTAVEFELIPEGPPQYELINGILTYMAGGNQPHQKCSWNLTELLGIFRRANRSIGVFYTAPFDVYLNGSNVFQPDLLFISAERMHILDKYVRGAPDLVVEILSPTTTKKDVNVKAPIYAQAGVKELWIVDVLAPTLTIFENQEGAWLEQAQLSSINQRVSTAVLPGLVLTYVDVFEGIDNG
jgi:Uma2 family endonuclease